MKAKSNKSIGCKRQKTLHEIGEDIYDSIMEFFENHTIISLLLFPIPLAVYIAYVMFIATGLGMLIEAIFNVKIPMK